MKNIIIFIPLLLAGCATVFGPSKDNVSISSLDKDTHIYVDGQYVGNGSATYQIPRGKTVSISAQKKGCAPSTLQTDKSIAGLTWVNILFWPGFIVDATTGSMQKADPTAYTVTPNCLSRAP